MIKEILTPATLGLFRSARITLAVLACSFILSPACNALDGEKSALEKIQARGTLTVALYREFAPFSDIDSDTNPYSLNGKGVDVDLAKALAAKLGVKLAPMWFDASEKVEDDFRKMVLQGTQLGYGPADVLMHVLVDPLYMDKIKKVKVLAAYHREHFAIGRNLEQLPKLENLAPFEKLPIAVEGESMGADVMSTADSGRYRANVRFFKNAEGSIEALKSGAVVAAIAQQGELEGGLKADTRFAIDKPLHPVLNLPHWTLGVAVKAESEDLAKALQTAMNELLADGTVARIKQSYGVADRKP